MSLFKVETFLIEHEQFELESIPAFLCQPHLAPYSSAVSYSALEIRRAQVL